MCPLVNKRFLAYEPTSNPQFVNTSNKPRFPELKLRIAEETDISRTDRLTKIFFGQRAQINPFKDSLLFCVFPCRHLSNNSGVATKFTKN